MKLSIVIGTYNRRAQLEKCIDSIFKETSENVKIYVTDAGSTDGTVEFLNSVENETIIPIFARRKLGQARAYNDVFALVDTPYVCWLSDDNVIVNRGLDVAISILDGNSEIGMVALKIKDKQGPFINAPYIGGISSIGILNVNQGMLPTKILKQVGGFSEEFVDYGIDPDLTAKVFFAGYKVVYTKKISIHHFRNWSTYSTDYMDESIKKKHKKYFSLYDKKYEHYMNSNNPSGLNQFAKKLLSKLLTKAFKSKQLKNKSILRDLYNALNSEYISVFDIFVNINKKYHLVQVPPKS